MKDKYGWHLPLSKEEIKRVWNDGLLTVDANVLLDLYRYHDNTRNSLLESISMFEGRTWISNQAATEFFRNRKKVIVSSAKGFQQAADEIAKLRKNLQENVSQLSGNRLIPDKIVDQLEDAIFSASDTALEQISAVEKAFPDFLKSDPILDKLLNIFNNAVGEDFKPEDKEAMEREAERRKQNNIPPGYKDKTKEGDRVYGDFYLWRQILNHSRDSGRPIVLVTSERKEDWWEEHSGKVVGPRMELLEDISLIAKQTVLIYHTTKFIEHVSEHFGSKLDQSVVEEIRAVGQSQEKPIHAVEVLDQISDFSTGEETRGALYVALTRPMMHFTATGHFSPRLNCVPAIKVKLTGMPAGVPSLRSDAGTGTVYDFNVHVRSLTKGIPMPAGIYVFEYEAYIEGELVEDEFEGKGGEGVDA